MNLSTSWNCKNEKTGIRNTISYCNGGGGGFAQRTITTSLPHPPPSSLSPPQPIYVKGCTEPYYDYADISLSVIKKYNYVTIPDMKRKGPRGGVITLFPERLYIMLEQIEKDGLDHIISWQPHGRCFIIYNMQSFVNQILHKYFKQSKYNSFQRQINFYGFRRILSGPDRGGIYHPLFLRGRPDLIHVIFRDHNSKAKKSIDAKDKPGSTVIPSFYALPACATSDSSRTYGH